jgi:hypothetical protein
MLPKTPETAAGAGYDRGTPENHHARRRQAEVVGGRAAANLVGGDAAGGRGVGPMKILRWVIFSFLLFFGGWAIVANWVIPCRKRGGSLIPLFGGMLVALAFIVAPFGHAEFPLVAASLC